MIPAFIDVGQPDMVLPAGLHDTNELEIRALLVDKFPASTTRATIFARWQAFSAQVRSLVPIIEERLNGSFVTSREDPKDVDVALWIDADELGRLDPLAGGLLGDLLAKAKPIFNCDTYLVPRCAPGHPAYLDFQYMLWTDDYWQRYSNPNKVIVRGVSKGYLRVRR